MEIMQVPRELLSFDGDVTASVSKYSRQTYICFQFTMKIQKSPDICIFLIRVMILFQFQVNYNSETQVFLEGYSSLTDDDMATVCFSPGFSSLIA